MAVAASCRRTLHFILGVGLCGVKLALKINDDNMTLLLRLGFEKSHYLPFVYISCTSMCEWLIPHAWKRQLSATATTTNAEPNDA